MKYALASGEKAGVVPSFVLGSRKIGCPPTEQSDFRQPFKLNRLSGKVDIRSGIIQKIKRAPNYSFR